MLLLFLTATLKSDAQAVNIFLAAHAAYRHLDLRDIIDPQETDIMPGADDLVFPMMVACSALRDAVAEHGVHGALITCPHPALLAAFTQQMDANDEQLMITVRREGDDLWADQRVDHLVPADATAEETAALLSSWILS